MLALHRVDVSKHLFYPSTAEAEAAHAKEKENNNGGGGGKPKPLRIERLRRLPAPITGFESSPTTNPNWGFGSWREDMFVLLHGPSGRGGGEPGRILHANGDGHVTLYDADSHSVISVPDLTEPKGDTPIPFAIAGAAGEEESLYVMRSVPKEPAYNNNKCSLNFEVLDFGGGGDSSRRSYCLGHRSNLQWQPLPPPPMVDGRFAISTVLDGGRVICVSVRSPCLSSVRDGDGTFCFDTARRKWWRSGDWRLPFEGMCEYVPELGTWLGFSPVHPHHLCAADLSGVAMAGCRAEEPALQHVWEDFNPPPVEETSLVLNKRFPGIVHTTRVHWEACQLHLANLGSGRFCIAKVFRAEETISLSCSFDEFPTTKDILTVLIGVEVVRGGEGGLRMVKHKSKRFKFPGNRIKWVL
ncbi:hypothetical protein SETIT_2G049300v2 [Setaria italica]|nr:hypothetical protein SETIT_2G049300v2 [Setaria italica]